MTSNAATAEEYISGLPEDRRDAISAIRQVILKNLPKGYEEGVCYGHIAYYVPHSLFPQGYHCDPKQPLVYASLASQKNHMAVYLMCVYGDTNIREWFEEAYRASGKRLDMGKSCIRFKKLEDLPLDLIGQAIARVPVDNYVSRYLHVLAGMKSRKKK